MAVVKTWMVDSRLDHTLDYAMNKDKTEEQLYCSGINCEPENAFDQFNIVKKQYNKQGGSLAFIVSNHLMKARLLQRWHTRLA